MLEQLHIKNFAIIENLTLELNKGMTVITGETGAGKSIVIDALDVALGERAEGKMVRKGAEKSEISAVFNINNIPAAKTWLSEQQLEDGEECIIRRATTPEGRSRSWINGNPVTQQQLRELAKSLVHVHGQHEHHALLKREEQRALLDRYAKSDALLAAVQTIYSEWNTAKKNLEKLQSLGDSRARRDLLSYQVEELKTLALQENEVTLLHQEQKKLANVEGLLSSLQKTAQYIDNNEEVSMTQLLSECMHELSLHENIDNKIKGIRNLFYQANIFITEASSEVDSYLENLDADPERLQNVEQRLSRIHDLARKHHVAPEELHTLQKKLEVELASLENVDEEILRLQKLLEAVEKTYREKAKVLTQHRQKAAKKLEPLILSLMQQLGMTKGQFSIGFTEQEPSSLGIDIIDFLVTTNPGQPLQPLAKVVSGGELSRISLALQVITAQGDSTPTLIFDEVDVGIGGGTAEIVGKLLRQLSQHAQVICITHLPQVASQGHHHLKIDKEHEESSTVSRLIFLDRDAKVQEIARMLGGVKITSQTLSHAKEMLESVE